MILLLSFLTLGLFPAGAVAAEKRVAAARGWMTIAAGAAPGTQALKKGTIKAASLESQPAEEPVTQPLPQPVPDPAPQPLPDLIPQPVPDPAPQPAPEPAPQPAPAPAPQPAPAPVPQPVPAPSPQPAPNPAPAETVYTVQRGDSLFIIGRKFGVSITALKTANRLTGDAIYPGQRLIIPLSVTPAPSTGNVVYTVKGGDSLFLISKQFGASIYSIKTANGLASDTIYPGQQLQIPAVPGTPAGGTVKYTVQRGDSLYLIAQKYRVSIEALKSANGLTGNEIYPGQLLVIPAVATGSTPEVSRQITLSREDIDLMARVVYAEARGEVYEGQVAVAAVILNRLKHPDFPKSISGIVYEQYAFESVANGQINQAPDANAYQAVQDALDGRDPSGGALYFWNPAYSTSEWIKTRTVIKQIGNHVFAV